MCIITDDINSYLVDYHIYFVYNLFDIFYLYTIKAPAQLNCIKIRLDYFGEN